MQTTTQIGRETQHWATVVQTTKAWHLHLVEQQKILWQHQTSFDDLVLQAILLLLAMDKGMENSSFSIPLDLKNEGKHGIPIL